MKFKDGDKVVINPESGYCGDRNQLPEGVVGTVRSVSNAFHPYSVEWDRGFNSYSEGDLLPAPSSKTPRKHAELIKQWADDDSLVIQYHSHYEGGGWQDTARPSWGFDYEYRIKPTEEEEKKAQLTAKLKELQDKADELQQEIDKL